MPLIIWLSAEGGKVSHCLEIGEFKDVRTFTSSDANAAGFNLEAKTPLVLPEGCSNTGLHARRWLLPSGVKVGIGLLHGVLTGNR